MDDRFLRKLLRHDNKVELSQWSWGRQAADVLAEFPVRASAQEWATTLKRLQNRQYSISSSARTDPTCVDLTISVVRDQRNKFYVQDRTQERGHRLWTWLENGAHFYVCGDASRMAKDVDKALRHIITTHGGLTEQATDTYVKRLAADKRYVRDNY